MAEWRCRTFTKEINCTEHARLAAEEHRKEVQAFLNTEKPNEVQISSYSLLAERPGNLNLNILVTDVYYYK